MFDLFLGKMTFPYVLYTNHKHELFSGWHVKDKRSRDLVKTDFQYKIFVFFKDAQDSKEKSQQRRGAILMRSRTIRKIVEGGGGIMPRPPALLGLKGELHHNINLV